MQRVCTQGGAAAGEIFQCELLLLLYELMWRFRVGGHAGSRALGAQIHSSL